MRWVAWLTLVLAEILLLATSACKGPLLPIGDRAHEVFLWNGTATPVIVYEVGREHPSYQRRLEPDEGFHSSWLIPFSDDPAAVRAEYKVEADDTAGQRVFCRIFTVPELERLAWRIEIQRSVLEC